MSRNPRAAALGLLASAAVFSTGGAAIKAVEFHGWQIAALRSLIAGVTLVALIPAARRGWGWRPGLVGVASAATAICFVLANRLTTSASAIFIQAASPLYVLVLGPLVLHEKVDRRDLLFMVPIAAGLALFFLGDEKPLATAPDPLAGNLLAALSAFTFACMVIGLRWLARSADHSAATPITAAAMGSFIAGAVALPFALPIGTHQAGDWLLLLFLGVVQIGLGYALFTRAMSGVPALEASLLLMLEPVLNPFWSWLVHGEVPSGAAVAGGALVLGATVARAWWSEGQKGLTETMPPQ